MGGCEVGATLGAQERSSRGGQDCLPGNAGTCTLPAAFMMRHAPLRALQVSLVFCSRGCTLRLELCASSCRAPTLDGVGSGRLLWRSFIAMHLPCRWEGV